MIITIDVHTSAPDLDKLTAAVLDAVEDVAGVLSVDVVKVED